MTDQKWKDSMKDIRSEPPEHIWVNEYKWGIGGSYFTTAKYAEEIAADDEYIATYKYMLCKS